MSLWNNPLAALFNTAQPEQAAILNQKLHRAVESAAPPYEDALIDQIKPLLRQGADINATDADGNTIISKLCARGFDKAVDFAISKKAELLDVNAYADTALSVAARSANLPALKTVMAELQKNNMSKAIFSHAAEALAETHMDDSMAGPRFKKDAIECMRTLVNAGAEVSDEAQKYAARHVTYFAMELPKVALFMAENLLETRAEKAENDQKAKDAAKDRLEMRKIIKEDFAVNVQLNAIRKLDAKGPGSKA